MSSACRSGIVRAAWRVLFGTLVFGALRAPAQASPELTGIAPFSARPGETVDVKLSGSNLQNPLELWTSFGAKIEWHPKARENVSKDGKDSTKELHGRLTIPADAPMGLGFMRLATESGLSGPLFFFIDDLAVVKKGKSNDSFEKAQPVTPPIAIEGTTDATRADYYRFEMKAGESISIDVFAARLASALDPAIRLLDAHGNLLMAIDDTPGLCGDCRLRYRSDKDGPLILELRDAEYNGGGLNRYHLRIGDFPLVTGLYPPSGAPGTNVETRAMGEAVDGLSPITATAPKMAGESKAVAVRFAPNKPAAYASMRSDEFAAPANGKKIAAPCTLFGRIEKVGGRDTFIFPAKKNDAYTLSPVTRQLGSPAILYVAVEDEKGSVLASNDGPGNQATTESVTTFKAPSDGEFRVVVEDAAQRGGPDFIYGLHVERSDKGFALSIAAERFVVGRGGSFAAKVTAQRHGAKDAITLELASGDGTPLPPGFSIGQNVIDKGKNDTLLKIKAPSDVTPGTLFHVRVIGHSKEGSEEFTAAAALPVPDPNKIKNDHMQKATLAMPCVPRLLRETVAICVGPDTQDFFALQLTGGEVDLPTILGKNTFVIRQTAIDSSFDQPVDLKFEGLPSGITVHHSGGRGGRIKDQTDFVCEINGPPDLKLGVHTFKAVGIGSHKGVTKEVRLERMTLRIVKPLGIAADLEGTLAPGGSAKLKVAATRFGDLADAQPIDVELRHLPVGLTAPEKTTIPAGKSELEIDIEAAEKMTPGVFDNIQLLASTTVKGSAVSVEGAHVRIEVKK